MDTAAVAPPEGLTIRDLVSHEDRRQCVALQEATWGTGFSELVPSAILQVGPKLGGITAGAFEASGRLVGFVFGLTGVRHGSLAHWSDMLAVVPEYRGTGLGTRLKMWQRARCEELGVRVIYWTWDPLVARNSHLNLNKLGARVDEFVENMYGVSNSPQFGALPTDRFVAAWDLDPLTITRRLAARDAEAPFLGTAPLVAGGPDGTPLASFPDAPVVRVAIPADFPALLGEDPAAAAAYRRHSHAAFVHYFALRYHISSFHPAPDGGAYLLTRPLS
ncbi:MAG: GNAT family N-acetyltransferase [Gemmatimonadetes bacterium]|nr:GNAT family N-acetyltransferase [Gemmatimonadota bacterium]